MGLFSEIKMHIKSIKTQTFQNLVDMQKNVLLFLLDVLSRKAN